MRCVYEWYTYLNQNHINDYVCEVCKVSVRNKVLNEINQYMDIDDTDIVMV